MVNTIETKTGLPKDKMQVKPLLAQFNIGKQERNQSGTLIFPDGFIYRLVSDKSGAFYKWSYFTRLKEEGINLMKDLILLEFNTIEIENFSEPTSQNVLIWKSNFEGKSKTIKIASGSYSNLPPVFQKIDTLINKYMYKLNET